MLKNLIATLVHKIRVAWLTREPYQGRKDLDDWT